MPRRVLEAQQLVVSRRSPRSAFELRVETLGLHAGEALAVLGPNGSGKTTLLLALAGLLPAASGSLSSRATGPTTMVFQRPVAFAGSVEHNVRVALLGQRLTRVERDRRVVEALDRFAIAALAQRTASSLSGGEMRRVALARAFALRPAVLLLDEPFDDLDAAAQERLSSDLRQACDSTGVALVLVSHDLGRAVRVADRIAVLIAGRVMQVGEVDDVLRRPSRVEVARLVGMSNLIPGVVGEKRDGSLARVDLAGGQRVEVETTQDVGAPVWVGIRPERLKLGSGGDPTQPLGEAEVRSLSSDGVITTLSLEWAPVGLRTHFVSGRGPARRFGVGDRVQISARTADLHVMNRPLEAVSQGASAAC